MKNIKFRKRVPRFSWASTLYMYVCVCVCVYIYIPCFYFLKKKKKKEKDAITAKGLLDPDGVCTGFYFLLLSVHISMIKY